MPNERALHIDKTSISPFDNYCDGYARPGAQGIGYISVVKVVCGTVLKSNDFLIDGIVAYDRAEANDAYIGQINMETASSFCGIAGQVWGYDLAESDTIKEGKETLLFEVDQYDGSKLPVYDAEPLIDAGIELFGREGSRRFPPAPGAHVICANKSVTAFRPASGPINPNDPNQAYGVWAYIALSIRKDRDGAADLFIEDAGVWTQDDSEENLKAFLTDHCKVVASSIVACGEDQSVLYDRTFMSFRYVIMPPSYVGTALTVAPYVSLARNAVPAAGFGALNDMTLSQWKAEMGFGEA